MLVESAPRIRKVMVPGAAHMLNLEQRDTFNAAVLEFLAERAAVGYV